MIYTFAAGPKHKTEKKLNTEFHFDRFDITLSIRCGRTLLLLFAFIPFPMHAPAKRHVMHFKKRKKERKHQKRQNTPKTTTADNQQSTEKKTATHK